MFGWLYELECLNNIKKSMEAVKKMNEVLNRES